MIDYIDNNNNELISSGPQNDDAAYLGRIFNDRYKAIAILGRGAFASVYLVDDLNAGEEYYISLVQ